MTPGIVGVLIVWAVSFVVGWYVGPTDDRTMIERKRDAWK